MRGVLRVLMLLWLSCVLAAVQEWMNFLERLAADPLGSDANYRLVQKLSLIHI